MPEILLTTLPVTSIIVTEQFFMSEEIIVEEPKGFGNMLMFMFLDNSVVPVVLMQLTPLANG